MKRIIIIILILVSVIGLSFVGYRYAMPEAEPVSPAEDPTVEIVPVELETLVDTVNAAGQIDPKAEVDMAFEIGGAVEEVLVKRGQYVIAGTVLARLDTDDLELNLQEADINLAQAEAALEQLLEPELAEKISSAQADVETARLELADLLDGPDEDEVTKAEVALQQSQIELKKAQWAYDQVAYQGDIGARSEADSLQEATLNYESALADYNIAVKDATKAEIAKARGALAGAQATLAELLDGPSAAEVASKQGDIDKAQLALQEAKNNLEQAVLVAPTDGVVLSIDIEPGERVLSDADQAALVIADTSAFQLTVEVDEIDIGQISPGQAVEITLDAFADEPLDGQVVDISPSPVEADGSSIVTYEVVISVDATNNNRLLPGMTATAAIETNRLEDALVVPNRAIQLDRDSTPSIVYVEKLDEDGNVMRVEVELGLRNGSVTEVKAGLEEGDQVLIRTLPPSGPEPNI